MQQHLAHGTTRLDISRNELLNGLSQTPTKNSYVFAYGWCPSSYGYLTVIGLMTYLFFFAPGMGPMPWTINAEIYPLWARSTCNSIATSTNWFFNVLVSVTFLTMTEILTREGPPYYICTHSSFVTCLLDKQERS